MMDHRRALTISLAVDKVDKSQGSPLKIPKTLRSSESGCVNDEPQIHWTQIAGNRIKLQDSCQHNGSTSMATNCRQINLVLTDVLKTKQGQAFLDRKRRGQMAGNGGRKNESRLGPWRKREPHSIREVKEDQAAPISTRKERRSFNRRSEEEIEEELMIEESSDDQRCSKDVTLSRRRRSEISLEEETFTEGGRNQEKPYPQSTRTRKSNSCSYESTCAEGEGRRRESGLHCNGQMKDGWVKGAAAEDLTPGTTRGSRGSVLRLSKDARPDEDVLPKRLCLEEARRGDSGVASIEVEVEPLDGEEALVVVTVGEDGHVPSPSSCGRVRERRGAPKISLNTSSLNTSRDTLAKLSPPEPIVLSSDEEEVVTPNRGSVLCPQTDASESIPQRKHAWQDNTETERDSQVVPVRVTGFGVNYTRPGDSQCMGLPFSALHCGGIRGEACGVLSVTNQRIIIPVKEPSGQVEVMVTVERCQLWKYSVWDMDELHERGLGWEGDGDRGQTPPACLLLYVSDVQAASVQGDLSELSIKQALDPPTGPASPFLLLTLRDHLDGVEGALLRSVLDIICLNNAPRVTMTGLRGIDTPLSFQNPQLSLDDSLALVCKTGLDPQLLNLLDQNSAMPGTDQDPEPEEDRDIADLDLGALGGEVEPQASPQTDLLTEQQTDEEHKGTEKVPHTEDIPARPRPMYTVSHRRTKDSYLVSLGPEPVSDWSRYSHQGPARRLIQFPPPPSKGGLTVTTEDLECLDNGQFLNDVIIDFYIKYLLLEKAPVHVAERSHVFSSFFYKQLTRRDNASEDSSSVSAQQRRHQRVKNWTRHVDIFKKDFLFVPVNQESHWYLVVVCFPGLEEPQCEPWSGREKPGEAQAAEEAPGSKKLNGLSESLPESTSAEGQEQQTLKAMPDGVAQGESVLKPPPAPLNCTEKTCRRAAVTKRPCILIMDSLKFSLHERVFKLLREYLQSEWEVRRGSVREFSSEQLKGSHCKVPLQDNSSDCGLYLLQYVESFLQDPVVHFDLPLCLERWFPRQQVRRKRDEIRDLVLHLYRLQRDTMGSIGNVGNVVC
ncbi:hypothetical protein UPYG_G00306600 [Umbra pygmaea]|uniref:Ubiquitin-like protease family profile domain-containing protein n=1 Tax=Umbra pygmaea TaxID=75934 RepID=A0ABD0W3E8_UMBPY